MKHLCGLLVLVLSCWPSIGWSRCQAAEPRRNILFVLVDDQRHDAMSCAGHPFLQTPAMDALAAGGVRFKNAYVTTSLCSPSRASILTGLYAHSHRVIDNQSGMSDKLVLFNELLQQAGYETAFIGKWHMGHDSDAPRRGWNHWVSFAGQGNYYPQLPNGRTAMLNVNGKRVPQTKYITDELTDYALDWLTSRPREPHSKPWMLYLSHKAAHADFTPAERHRGKYAPAAVKPFPTTQGTPLDELRPMWARNQRNSWHGVEHAFHGRLAPIDDVYRRYCETLLAVDESLQRLLDWLRDTGQLQSTLVIFMGDNGHLWGEHGLIDKRTAYEASIRVPLLMHCPELFPKNRVMTEMVANIDIAPTILEAAGVKPPQPLHGQSLLSLARGISVPNWRHELLYEYFWERWVPSTPTLHALITPRWKYVRPYGLWDLPELYDLQTDPDERHNLAAEREHRDRLLSMDKRLFELLAETGGDSIPLFRGWNGTAKEDRSPNGSLGAPFPPALIGPPRANK